MQILSSSCVSYVFDISNVTYTPIARQRLGKHIPAGANARKKRASVAADHQIRLKQYGRVKDRFPWGSAPRRYNEEFQGSKQFLSIIGSSSGDGSRM
jgi:hypothetical protein